MQRVEKHLWPTVIICNYVNTSTRNQPKNVHTHLETDPELRQGIWWPFFPQAIQIFLLKARQYIHIRVIFSFIYSKTFNWCRVNLDKKVLNILRNLRRQIWNQKQFYSNSKKNTGVLFASYSFQWLFILFYSSYLFFSINLTNIYCTN